MVAEEAADIEMSHLAASACCTKLGMLKLVSLMPEDSPVPRAVHQVGRRKMMQKSLQFN